MESYNFEHKQLGNLIGLARGDDVVQFRGIPFASIPARFRQSQLLGSLPQQPFDARQPGPYCPQPHLPYPTYWDGDLPADVPTLQFPPQDEFGCLNLNISVPRDALEKGSASKLPVFFFIHGGAFVGGSQSIQVAGREIYDGTNLVRAAVARNQPVVVISCNYRVGSLGFLASAELAAYNKAHGEPVGNYGLHDQRQALEWCAKFIDQFGGDAGNITIQGTSAGGSSAHFQSIFRDRKFKRAILSSGTMVGIGPMPQEFHQRNFDTYLARHDVESKTTGQELIGLLQSVPVSEMVKPISDSICHPLVDRDWISGSTVESTSHIDSESDAPDLMIGACDFEADITRLILMDDLATKKPKSDELMLGKIYELFSSNGMIVDAKNFPFTHPDVTKAYGLDASLQTPSTTLESWADLLADLAFRIPPLHIAQQRSGPGRVLAYDIRASNPYPSWAWSYGRANHAVNDLFVFDVAPDRVPPELSARHDATVAQVRAAWLDFCHGVMPWSPVRRGDAAALGPVFVFQDGPEGREAETLEGAVGPELAGKWRAVLRGNGWEA